MAKKKQKQFAKFQQALFARSAKMMSYELQTLLVR